MFRDKLKKLIGKDEGQEQEGNNKRKIENLVFFIVILIITIVAIIIGLLFICKCLIENSLLFLVSLKFRTFLELMTSLFTLWTDMFVWTVFSPVADLKAVSTQNCITAVLCKMSMSERRSNPTLPLHNDDTWPHWDNS